VWLQYLKVVEEN
jgi:hypothetical protein